MFNPAKRLLAWLLLVPAGLMLSHQALAEGVQRWAYNMTEGVTPVSREIFTLHMQMFWLCVVIAAVVFAVMLYTVVRHRKSRGVTPANFHESTALEILWTVIPMVILIVMAVPATKTLIKIYDTSEADMDILITGNQWNWRYEYLDEDVSFISRLSTTRDQIENRAERSDNYLLEVDNPLVIPVEQKVRFLITASDVIHSWWVPDFGFKQDAIPGFINENWAYVEEPGIYRGMCAELCGRDHGFMPIVVEALPQDEYDEWLENKRAEQAQMRELTQQEFSFEELYERGEQVYQRACASCHGADGEGVGGAFPGLRGGISVGPMEGHIDIVVNGARGTAMPAFANQLSELEIAAVVTYERNAWGNNMGDEAQPIDVFNHIQDN